MCRVLVVADIIKRLLCKEPRELDGSPVSDE
jgi:hypothetical protein